TAAHAHEVKEVLASLGVDPADTFRVLEVWNKIDLLDPSDRERLLRDEANKAPPVAVSAVTGEGVQDLLRIIEERISGALEDVKLTIRPAKMSMLGWIYKNGQVTSREDHEDGSVTVHVRATEAARAEFERRLA